MNVKFKKQLKLYGYKNVFDELIKIYKNGKFPNKILFSGMSGTGKSTFAYHLTNYFLSFDEEEKYDISENKINENNKSYKLIFDNCHPNFFKIDLKEDKKNIEISQIREMINFINKTSFDNKNRIILINKVELLNVNSVNALLKTIEEPNDKVFFFLIHNNEKKIIQTLKSRCIEFKLKLNKENIETVVNSFFDEDIYKFMSKDFVNYFNSPSIYINFITFCKKNDLNFKEITIEEFIKYLISFNIYKKDNFIKNNIKYYVELFFMKKAKKISNNEIFDLVSYFNKKFNLFVKYNLDLESYFLEFKSKLLNE